MILRNVNSLPVSTLDANKAYAEFCDTFKTILDKHAPLKSKVLRGNHAPFITKELSKGIMTRSRLKNKFSRHRTKENWNAYKIQRNNCVQLRTKAIKSYFEQNTKSGDVSNKLFWKTIRPFLSSNAGINLTGYHPPPRANCRATNFFRQNPRPRDSFSVQNSGPRVGRKETKSPPPGIICLVQMPRYQ